MKTAAKVSIENGIANIRFDIFEAVWGYILFDNTGIMADSRNNILKLFSFATGKEHTTVELSKSIINQLSECDTIELNYMLGEKDTIIYKKEAIDVTGKLLDGIEAQFSGKNATAVECYKAVVEANPHNFRAYNLLGRCLRAEGRMDDAYSCYEKAIEIAPWSPEAYCNMGVLFQKKGEEKLAQAAFEKAIEVDNYYCNALLKRAAWLLENKPGTDYELRLINLRLSTAHQDVTASQNHIKSYMEKMGYDRIAYLDKETALFGDYADSKLQKKLKIIESSINNGAFALSLNKINEVLAETKENSAKDLVAGWCHTRAERVLNRISEETNSDLFAAFKKILAETPEEVETKQQIAIAEAKEAEIAVKNIDRVAAEAASKAAIAEIENEVSADGDYAQPIAGPVEKKLTEEEKAEALAEQEFLTVSAPAPVPAPTVAAAPAPITAPEPEPTDLDPVSSIITEDKEPVIETPSNNTKPQPVENSQSVEKPETDKLKEADSVDASEAIKEKDANNSEQNNQIKTSDAPASKPLTIPELFMMILYEMMRDGEIEETERKFLTSVKNLLKISDEDFTKMFNNVRNQVKAVGAEKGSEGKFNTRRVFKNLCKAALRDGKLEDSEKKVLVYAAKMFKIPDQEVKQLLNEARK